jgi:hypothetical protein
MTTCPGPDAIVAIGEAFDWNVADGVRHLQACEECREQIELLHLTRAAFSDAESVEPWVEQRIGEALHNASLAEAEHVRQRRGWIAVAEPVAAGVTGLLLLRSGGIQVESITGALVGFALGALAIVGGRLIAPHVPALGFADRATSTP